MLYALGLNPTIPFVSLGLKPRKEEARGIYPLAKAQRQVWNTDFKRQAKAAALVIASLTRNRKGACRVIGWFHPTGIKSQFVFCIHPGGMVAR